MNAKQIKNELKSIGITEAVGKSIIYNGKEAVLLDWNGRKCGSRQKHALLTIDTAITWPLSGLMTS